MSLKDSKGRNLLTLPLDPPVDGNQAVQAVTLVDDTGRPGTVLVQLTLPPGLTPGVYTYDCPIVLVPPS